MEWTFGTLLGSLVAFFFWFCFIWMFISFFADILRRDDLSGWAKAGWIVLIVVLPFLGILIYLIARPRTAAQYGPMIGEPYREGGAGRSAADQIAKAAQLHDQGRITAEEYDRLKQQALSY
jgi:Phospholipase_D-nuclease N-terminal